MISNNDMASNLIGLAKVRIDKLYKENVIVNYSEAKIYKIVEDADDFMNLHLNDFTKGKINCAKKASLLELILRIEMPLIIVNGSVESQISLNSKYALNVALFLLFDYPEVYLNTLQTKSVDEPFTNCLKNHMLWLKKSNYQNDNLPVFLNSSFWEAMKIIYNNSHNFYQH